MINGKRILILAICCMYCCQVCGQQKWVGLVEFRTTISVSKDSPAGFLNTLQQKYGDSLLMYYTAGGGFLRVYPTSGEKGNLSQAFLPGSGRLLIRTRDQQRADSLNVAENTMTLIERTRKPGDTIMGIPCRCIHYRAFDDYDTRVITFCYSRKNKKIPWRSYKTHQDYFVANYFRLAKRPYLKFAITAPTHTLEFTAVQVKDGAHERHLAPQ